MYRFQLRMPEPLRVNLEFRASQNNRSLNAEIVAILEEVIVPEVVSQTKSAGQRKVRRIKAEAHSAPAATSRVLVEPEATSASSSAVEGTAASRTGSAASGSTSTSRVNKGSRQVMCPHRLKPAQFCPRCDA